MSKPKRRISLDMAYTQRLYGSFSVRVTGLYHCGPNHDSPKTFHYDVKIIWPDSALDGNGFLADNTMGMSYFQSLCETGLSCELLAKQAWHDLYTLTGKRCDEIYVLIRPFDGAEIVYSGKAVKA